MPNTAQEYDKVIDICQDIFVKKMQDYGTAWRILRPTSITDQIYIKANRIRSIEEKGVTKVGEGIVPEFIGIINYSIMGLIQLQLGAGNDTPQDEVLRLYQNYFQKAKELMLAKNHDYDEAWREMRVSSYSDLILMKIIRTKQFGMKPMFPEDACVQMELLGHSFFVFRNADTDEVNVVYKRKGNTYGLIEPEC